MDHHFPQHALFESARMERYIMRQKLAHGVMLFAGDTSLCVILHPKQAWEWTL
jgi:hypothetical protein